MAFVHFERGYVPCGFLIVKGGANPHDEASTILIQSDWDYPSVASRMGWSVENVQLHAEPCEHSTDGTVDCEACGLKAGDFINAAYDHIREQQGETFAELDDYFAD